jgi:hypothetical protein
MTLTDEQREELSDCEECMSARCAICGHEPCPVCTDDCDVGDCIEWHGDGGTKTHTCVFVRCARHAELYAPASTTCAICFAPPGVECNVAPGWCGAIMAPPHARAPLLNPCRLCRGTGKNTRERAGFPGVEFVACVRCKGSRKEGC